MCFFSCGSYLVWLLLWLLIENGWLSTERASNLDIIHINYTFNPMTLWKVSSSLSWRMQPRLTFLFIYLFVSLFFVCCPITRSWKVALLVYNLHTFWLPYALYIVVLIALYTCIFIYASIFHLLACTYWPRVYLCEAVFCTNTPNCEPKTIKLLAMKPKQQVKRC